MMSNERWGRLASAVNGQWSLDERLEIRAEMDRLRAENAALNEANKRLLEATGRAAIHMHCTASVETLVRGLLTYEGLYIATNGEASNDLVGGERFFGHNLIAAELLRRFAAMEAERDEWRKAAGEACRERQTALHVIDKLILAADCHDENETPIRTWHAFEEAREYLRTMRDTMKPQEAPGHE